MINDEKMLQFIMKNAEMGCLGINDIKHYSNTAEMANTLRTQNAEYGHIYHNAFTLLRNIGGETRHVGRVVSAMARAKAKREMRNDSSNSHIAEMMINGNSMGVRKIAQHMRRYTGSNEAVTRLADKLLDTQQANIAEMKTFL